MDAAYCITMVISLSVYAHWIVLSQAALPQVDHACYMAECMMALIM